MSYEVPKKMIGMKLPGGDRVEQVEQDVPEAGIRTGAFENEAASLCGSDLKFIYHEHTDKTGGARYDNVIAGHEPAASSTG